MYHDVSSAVFKTTFGWAGIAASERGICRIVLPKMNKKAVENELRSETCDTSPISNTLIAQAVTLLKQYFSGERVSFDLQLDLRYYTRFQRAVWGATVAIPYGETRSYSWVAKKIKSSWAARAVGQALGANPIPIIIP